MEPPPGGQPNRQEFNVELQWNCGDKDECPDEHDLRRWAASALVADPGKQEQSPTALVAEVSIRIVDEPEMQNANLQWRGQDKSTNVLSFPADFPEETGLKYYGDMLICAPVVHLESRQQNKTVDAHWAHMVVHGMLHLQGYDHIEDVEAIEMERCEVAILAGLGYSNPYEPDPTHRSASLINITQVDRN